MKYVLAPLAMTLVMAATGFAAWNVLNEVPYDVGPGGGAVSTGERGYVFVVVGDDNGTIYGYDIAGEGWVEGIDDVPCNIINAGSISYETNYGTRLFVVYDDDSEDQDSIAVYQFFWPPSSHDWQGRWRDNKLPLPKNERPGPGVSTAFRPDVPSHVMMSGYLYLLWGNGTTDFYRYPIQKTPYAVTDGYAPDSSGNAKYSDVLLDWTPRVEPGVSEFQLDNSPSFDSPILDETTSHSQYHLQTAQANNTWFYWRARYKIDATHWTGWSSVWPYHTVNYNVTRRLYAFPEDSAILSTPNPIFKWTWTSGADRFRIQLDDGSTFPSPIADTQITLNEYRSVESLATGTYYWRTKYRIGAAWSAWSTKRMFHLENGWQTMAAVPVTVDEGASMCYTEHNGAESLWVLCGNYSDNFYNYWVHDNSWHQQTATPLDQYYGASITPGLWGVSSVFANCGGYGPLHMDSLVNRFRSADDWDRYHFLPSWTEPSRCTAYCAPGSAICFQPASLSSGDLYLMTAGGQRPNFWSLSISDDEEQGQAKPLGPVALPMRVVYEPDRIKISFSAIRSGVACARIYDASGRLVMRLEGSRAANGEQVFTWDETGSSGSVVERGAYFFTLDQNSGSVHLKLVVR